MDIYLAHILCTSNADLPEHLHYLHYSEWLQQLSYLSNKRIPLLFTIYIKTPLHFAMTHQL
jgi:hypothetical protein